MATLGHSSHTVMLDDGNVLALRRIVPKCPPVTAVLYDALTKQLSSTVDMHKHQEEAETIQRQRLNLSECDERNNLFLLA